MKNLEERLDKHIQNIKEGNTYIESIAKEIRENIEKYFKYKVRVKDLKVNYYEGNPPNFIISMGSNSMRETTFIDVYVYPEYLDVELAIEVPNTNNSRAHDIIKNYKTNCTSIPDIKRKLVPFITKNIINIWSDILKTPDSFNPEFDKEVERIRKLKQDNFNDTVKVLSNVFKTAKKEIESKSPEEIEKELKWKKQWDSREAMPKKVIKEMAKINYRVGSYSFTCINKNTCERDMFLRYKSNKDAYPQFIIEFPDREFKALKINGKSINTNHSPNRNEVSIICDDGKPHKNWCSYPDNATPEEKERISNRTIRPYIERIDVPFSNWSLQKIVSQLPNIVKEVIEDFVSNFNERLTNRLNKHLFSIREDGNWNTFMRTFNGWHPFSISTKKSSEMEVFAENPYKVEICNKQMYPTYPSIIISFPGDWDNRNNRDSKTIKIIKAESSHKMLNITTIPFNPDVSIIYRKGDSRIKELHNSIYNKIIPIVQKLIDSDKNFENKPVGILKLKHPIRSILRDWELPKALEEYFITIYSPLERGLTFKEYIQELKNIPNSKWTKLGIDIMTVDIKSNIENEAYTLKEIYSILEDEPIYYVTGEGELKEEIEEEIENWELLSDKQWREISKWAEEVIEKLIWDNREKIVQNCKNYIKGE